jgi:predicted amidophosphoribosyltransferase
MKTSMSLNEIEALGFNLQDNICVYCSLTMDRWDKICRNCREYKSVVNIVEAVGYYGKEILPL